MNDVLASTSDDRPPASAAGRARPGNRRDQILDAALTLFAQKGMAHVTTRQIAQAVGISQPSLYAHFRNADEIGGELCVRAFETLTARMQHVGDVQAPARDRLALMGRAYVEFGLDNPDMYRIAFMREDMKHCGPEIAAPGASADLPDSDPVLGAGIRCFSVMHQVVCEMLGDEGPQAMLVAQLVWVRVHGLVSLLIARPQFPWVERDALIDGLMAQLPL